MSQPDGVNQVRAWPPSNPVTQWPVPLQRHLVLSWTELTVMLIGSIHQVFRKPALVIEARVASGVAPVVVSTGTSLDEAVDVFARFAASAPVGVVSTGGSPMSNCALHVLLAASTLMSDVLRASFACSFGAKDMENWHAAGTVVTVLGSLGSVCTVVAGINVPASVLLTGLINDCST